jgi:YfiH family protein
MISVATDAPVRAVFTTRDGGLDLGTTGRVNDHQAVRESRRRLCETLGIDAERVTMGHQVHGASVRRVDAPTRPGRFAGGLSGWPEGDALVTSTPGLALVILGADCLPVLAWRRNGSAVVAAHAGWRGLVKGVVERAARALGDPAGAAAAIGPGIGPCCYATGADVRDRFRERFGPEVVAGAAVNLAHAARLALLRTGVPGDAIVAVQACTSCEPERFYSYRRDGPLTGRQAGVIWIDGAMQSP